MRNNNILTYVLITVVVLMIFGVIEFGDVLSVIGYIVLGIVLLVVIGAVALSLRIRRLRRQMEQQGTQAGSQHYTWGFGNRSRNRQEGDITVEQTGEEQEKRVNDKVGDYVDFEEEK